MATVELQETQTSSVIKKTEKLLCGIAHICIGACLMARMLIG